MYGYCEVSVAVRVCNLGMCVCGYCEGSVAVKVCVCVCGYCEGVWL